MAFSDAIGSADIDGGDDEYLPLYQCESCGAEVPAPGECDACLAKLEEFVINCANDPRRA